MSTKQKGRAVSGRFLKVITNILMLGALVVLLSHSLAPSFANAAGSGYYPPGQFGSGGGSGSGAR